MVCLRVLRNCLIPFFWERYSNNITVIVILFVLDLIIIWSFFLSLLLWTLILPLCFAELQYFYLRSHWFHTSWWLHRLSHCYRTLQWKVSFELPLSILVCRSTALFKCYKRGYKTHCLFNILPFNSSSLKLWATETQTTNNYFATL